MWLKRKTDLGKAIEREEYEKERINQSKRVGQERARAEADRRIKANRSGGGSGFLASIQTFARNQQAPQRRTAPRRVVRRTTKRRVIYAAPKRRKVR